MFTAHLPLYKGDQYPMVFGVYFIFAISRNRKNTQIPPNLEQLISPLKMQFSTQIKCFLKVLNIRGTFRKHTLRSFLKRP